MSAKRQEVPAYPPAEVLVPHVVGLTVTAGARAAGAAGLKLSQTDPDGPPISALIWPDGDRFRILAQQPEAGFRAKRWASLAVRFAAVDTDGTAGDREPRQTPPAPDVLTTASELPQREESPT